MNVDAKVLEAVKIMPDVSRPELHKLIPDEPSIAVDHAVTRLTRKGKLQVGQKPSGNRFGRRTVKSFSVATKPVKPRPDPTPAPTAKVPIIKVHELQREVEELRAWKADALRRYPDLAVDPIILEARKIAASEFEGAARQDILKGGKDDSPVMRAVIAALGKGN